MAAGQGTRLRKHEREFLKPLTPLCGRPLISYVFEALAGAGVTMFHVVVGFARQELVPEVRRIVPREIEVGFIANPDWRLSNGVSLLHAKEAVRGSFFLSMSDHLYKPEMVRLLAAGAIDPSCLYLAVDRRVEEVFDLDDATKVKTEDSRLLDIGKDLSDYNAIDTGLFICPPTIFDHLETARLAGDCSVSDGVHAMAERDRARVVDIGGAFWQDVDTPQMLAHAEAWLTRQG